MIKTPLYVTVCLRCKLSGGRLPFSLSLSLSTLSYLEIVAQGTRTCTIPVTLLTSRSQHT